MKKYIFMVFAIICMASCSEEIWRGIPTDADSQAPPAVTNVLVTPTAGGATITYTLPKSENVLYVMVEYVIGGKTVQRKSSYYSNTLSVEGFPDTKEYDLKLYTVSRDGIQSTPVNLKLTPLTPPIITTFNSIVMEPTFGGVRVHFQNENESEIKLIVLTTDSLGDLYTADTYYTKRKNGSFAVRGFDAVHRKFGLFILDRWDNYSDTVYTELLPYYEIELDKNKFKALNLPTDTYEPHLSGTSTLNKLWDGVWGTNSGNNILHTKPNTGIPQWFTFDLGIAARLSRYKLFHRLAGSSGASTDGQYSAGAPREWEVYGSNDPNPDGSWDSSWTLLGKFASIKPSGEAGWTSEDIQYACHDGEDFEFLEMEHFRYLRFKITKLWGVVTYIYIAELTFWGEPQ